MSLSLEELSFKLIAVFEGLRLSAYKDAVGIWTIGYGHTHEVKEGDVCTKEQALAWFSADCKSLFDRVRKIPLLEAAALVSFGYNCGMGALEAILVSDDRSHILLYDKAGTGKYKIPGLTTRRELEYSLIEVSRTY